MVDPEVSRWIRFISAGTTGPSSQRFSRITTVGAANFQGALGKGVCTLKDDKRWNLTNQQKDWMVDKNGGRFVFCVFFLYAC